MRYRDAAHIDLGSFYARLPGVGRLYRLLGYAACIGAVWWIADLHRIACLLIVSLVAWLMAWWREAGALWRSPLVAAIAMCAVILSADRLGKPLVVPPSAKAEMQADDHFSPPVQRRPIEIRFDLPDPGVKP